MTTWIGFLRAINLGATRRFPKEAIVAAVRAAGGREVATHLNTGNVRLEHDLEERAAVELALEKAFGEAAGFEVPTVCVTPAELVAIAEQAEAFGHDGLHYVSLLKEEPSPQAVAALEARSTAEEVARVGGRAAHLMLPARGYHGARLTNAAVERHLGVATSRNLTVIRTLAQRWGR